MTRISASAPGKVVVAGEYAVLDGAPAVAMAVDRRAVVTMQPAAGSTHTLTAPGYLDGRWRFEWTDGNLRWLDEPPAAGSMHLLECVFAECAWDPAGPADVTIDSRTLHDPASAQKLGFGSSAAVAVSLTAACRFGSGASDAVDDAAERAHRRFQGNRGSGVDIAAALSGGVIRFTRNASPEHLAWPEGLHYRLYWSGRPASTRAKIERSPNTEEGSLRAAADAVALVWERADTEEILSAMSEFTDALQAFDAATGTGVFAAGHAELCRAGKDVPGLVYKPCGAGGGDVGIAVASDREAVESFDALARASGFTVLDASMDPRGVQASAEAT